jgi:regulator of cell morphogenesis and NO signaling
LLDEEVDPTEKQIADCPIEQLVGYLQESHRCYRETALPNIGQLIGRVAALSNESHGKALIRFFNEYRLEVEKHLANEDNKVFPYILKLLNELRSGKFSIRNYKDHHNNIELKLTDLKNIIIKYIPCSETDNLRDKLLIQLFEFEEDLNRHTLIEEKLLVPSVVLIEQRLSLI